MQMDLRINPIILYYILKSIAFDFHRKGGKYSNFKVLEAEYKDLFHIIVLLINCKCGSIETGMQKITHNKK